MGCSSWRRKPDSQIVLVFKEGNLEMCIVLQKMGIEQGQNTYRVLKKIDKKRIRESNRSAVVVQKKIGKSRRRFAKATDDINLQTEGPTYAPGGL